MSQSINLVPQEEQHLQRRENVVKLSSVVSIAFLVLSLLVSGFYWYQTRTINQQKALANQNIESLRADINALAEFEIIARSLDAKFKFLTDIFSTRQSYSALLSELKTRVPENVTLESLSMAGDKSASLNLSGSGENYLSIAQFLNSLAEKNDSSLNNLFKDVTLNSVTLDSQSLIVNYFIVTNYNSNLIIK